MTSFVQSNVKRLESLINDKFWEQDLMEPRQNSQDRLRSLSLMFFESRILTGLNRIVKIG
jgi:hypothetical protein